MEYRKIGDNYYIRMDRGDEIISSLLAVCEKKGACRTRIKTRNLIAEIPRKSFCKAYRELPEIICGSDHRYHDSYS